MLDIPRIALYSLLALIVITLMNAWQRDYGLIQVTPAPPLTQPGVQGPASPAALTQGPTSISSQTAFSVSTNVLTVGISPEGDIVSGSLSNYPKSLQDKTPYVLFSNQPDHFYVAQSGFKLANTQLPVIFHTDKSNYQLAPNQNELQVLLTAKTAQGLILTKTYIFTRGSYVIKETTTAKNLSGLAITGTFYSQLIRKDVPAPPNNSIIPFLSRTTTQNVAAYSASDQPYQKLSFKKMAQQNLQVSTPTGWVAMLEHYFLSAWIPPQGQSYNFYTQNNDDLYTIGIQSRAIELQPGQQVSYTTQLYAGPLIMQDLKALAPNLDLTVDYGWLWMISDVLFWLLKHIHSVVRNWGWAIVIVTLLIKAAFYKLSAKSYQSMSAMRKLQPKMQQLRERFGDDRQKLSRATMELYKKEKINPLGGCLPILVQIPVFLALYWVLLESVELRQAPFILWIHDLSTPDPYYVLPILMGISMFIQQKLSPPPPDPAQAKVMLIMPLVLTLFFLNFPAGLVLYWFVNNTISVIQQWVIMRTYDPAPAHRKS